jgi:hypothetical protein
VTGIGNAAASSRRGGIAIAVSCLIFGLAALPHEPVLAAVTVLVGAAVQVVGEVAFAAGSWELGFALADPDHPGQWQGVFGAGIPVARAVGPLLLTVVVVDWDGPGWLVLASVLLLAATLVPHASRRAAHRRAERLRSASEPGPSACSVRRRSPRESPGGRSRRRAATPTAIDEAETRVRVALRSC